MARESTWFQVRPLRLPTSQPSAASASNRLPRATRKLVALEQIQDTPMPTRMMRYPVAPPFHASTYTSSAVASAPSNPSVDSPSPPVQPRTTAATTAVPAPSVSPIMSGLASGLRVIVWNTAPETPNATPTSSPTRARGSRRSWTTMTVPASPEPHRARMTSVKATG